MKFPRATYRLQFSSKFGFDNLQENLNYLEALGISTIYASPIFKARPGSAHGYDVVDASKINPEIGSLAIFKNLAQELEQREMDWLQDIVPNHMAYDKANPWIQDLLEQGEDSKYREFFDIAWDYKNWQKVLAPFLGTPLSICLQQQELQLKITDTEIGFQYFDQFYPANKFSYFNILQQLKNSFWTEKFQNFTGNSTEWGHLKQSFFQELQQKPKLLKQLQRKLKRINTSEEKMNQVLALQVFIPTYWKITETEINYRRFFTINELICLRMENQSVFETYHRFIAKLCKNKLVQGLRVDHIDGLFSPKKYLHQLRSLVGPEQYLVVEKILGAEEKLPEQWSVEGTTGYSFLNDLSQLMVNPEAEVVFSKAYASLVPEFPDYEAMVFQKKQFVLRERMGGELHNAFLPLKELEISGNKKFEDELLQEALGDYLAAFPVYRIYPERFPLKPEEKNILKKAYQTAFSHNPQRKVELKWIHRVFCGEEKIDLEKQLYFLKRCQQYTGPLAAKGVEDTIFYLYNRLISLNEVGGAPDQFGISPAAFHRKIQERYATFPHALNATATHDTKRGEDARMRLQVLSELPDIFFQKCEEWHQIGLKIRDDSDVPDRNVEYFIFQCLLGHFPFEETEKTDFKARIQEYLQKSLREAKQHSNWSQPNTDYEDKVLQYIANLLEDESFLESFLPFQEKIAFFGILKSLGQLLLKCSLPGIPDIYQGSELWDFSFVDPDNRRPVDFQKRQEFLKEIQAAAAESHQFLLNSLFENYKNGKIKLFCLHRILEFRKQNLALFQDGRYLSLELPEAFSNKIFGFIRKGDQKWVLVLIPLRVTEFFEENQLLPRLEKLANYSISLPENAPRTWKNLFSETEIITSGKLNLANAFREFPVVCLHSIKPST